MQDTTHHAERAAQVLSLVVQHSTQLHTPLRDICALLQTHSTVRRALQQLRVRYTVELPFGPLPFKYGTTTAEDVERSAVRREAWLASFTEWLPRHASLVGAIKYDGEPWQPHQEQQLAVVLRLCRLQTTAEALPPLRLVSLHKYSVPVSTSLLGELAYVSLQELHIESVDFDTPHMPSFCAALQRLASLRHLSMLPGFDDVDDDVEQHVLASDGVVEAVAQLSCLTSLHLGLLRRECVVRFAPSLQELGIDETLTTCGCEIVDVSHLTALTKLVLREVAVTIPELVLPPQLTSLGSRGGACEAVRAVPARLTGASGLQLIAARVTWYEGFGGLRFLECLSSLPSLGELSVFLRPIPLDALMGAATALGTLTRLTSLALCAVDARYASLPVVDLCGPLSRLLKLHCLELSDFPVCQQGTLGLTALSSLTQLKLHNVGLDDVSAIALTMHLTGLQHLHIVGDVNSRTLMPAAAGLRALRFLLVGGVEGQGVRDRELLLLSGLTQLSHLTLRRNKCTDSGKQRLMSHLRCLPAVLG